MALSNYLQNLWLSATFGSTSFVKPSTYVALYTVAPTNAGSGAEVSGGSYARQTVTWSVAGSSPTTASNSSIVTFPASTADWGTVVAVGILDAASAGNLLEWAPLTATKTIFAGDQLTLPAGQLAITLT